MEVIVRRTWLSQKPKSIAKIVVAISTFAVVLGSAIFWLDIGNAKSLMSASFQSVFIEKEYWRAWSTLFVHSDLKHLLSNLVLFFVMGFFLAGYFGIFAFPIIPLFFGGMTNFIVLHSISPTANLIGSSGVVFWLGGAWLTLYFLLDRQRSIAQRTFRALGVGLILFMPAEAFNPQISYLSHLVGFVLGVFWALPYFLFRRREFLSAEIVEIVMDGDSPLHEAKSQ